MTERLARGADQQPAPVRLLHVGLGNFFRAHQAWYTAHAPDADEWGYAAFTGNTAREAQALAPQDGLYTLIIRGAERDDFEVVPALSAVHAATDHAAWLEYMRDPEVAVVTVTVTEAGYMRGADGGLDLADEGVAADVSALREDPAAPVRTVPARIVAGLLARRAAGAGALTLLSCDNLPGNGAVLERVVSDLAGEVAADLRDELVEDVDFATSMVDRITPRASDDDRELVERECGYADQSPVVTEPFTEWVVAGRFPAGRPRWEEAGATFVDDVEPYERRKLLLLNGAHSLMAYAGSALGHETVDQAFADGRVRAWVEELWDDATALLEIPDEELADYRAALRERFANDRMRDSLSRIAMDGSQKLPVRHVPVLQFAREEGELPGGAVVAVAAWIAHLRGAGAPVDDVRAEHWQGLASGEPAEAVAAVVGELAPGLGDDEELLGAIRDRLVEFEGTTVAHQEG